MRADSGEEVVRRLFAALAESTDAILDPRLFYRELVERMQLAPVCIAPDVALPHARTTAVSRMVTAVARAESAFYFDAEHPDVRLVFLIGTPKDAVVEYLEAVAALSRVLRNPTTRTRLEGAGDKGEFCALLSEYVSAVK